MASRTGAVRLFWVEPVDDVEAVERPLQVGAVEDEVGRHDVEADLCVDGTFELGPVPRDGDGRVGELGVQRSGDDVTEGEAMRMRIPEGICVIMPEQCRLVRDKGCNSPEHPILRVIRTQSCRPEC